VAEYWLDHRSNVVDLQPCAAVIRSAAVWRLVLLQQCSASSSNVGYAANEIGVVCAEGGVSTLPGYPGYLLPHGLVLYWLAD
jgi:hypothetical protein